MLTVLLSERAVSWCQWLCWDWKKTGWNPAGLPISSQQNDLTIEPSKQQGYWGSWHISNTPWCYVINRWHSVRKIQNGGFSAAIAIFDNKGLSSATWQYFALYLFFCQSYDHRAYLWAQKVCALGNPTKTKTQESSLRNSALTELWEHTVHCISLPNDELCSLKCKVTVYLLENNILVL